MSNPTLSNQEVPQPQSPDSNESFGDMLAQYEKSHARKRTGDDGPKQLEGVIIAVSADSVYLDIGFKSEGILPLADFQASGETPKSGGKLLVSVKGRDPEVY